MACWYWSVQPRPPLLSSSSSSSLSRTGLSNGQVRLSVLTWANSRGCKGKRAVSPAWWGSERTQVIPQIPDHRCDTGPDHQKGLVWSAELGGVARAPPPGMHLAESPPFECELRLVTFFQGKITAKVRGCHVQDSALRKTVTSVLPGSLSLVLLLLALRKHASAL